MSDDSARWPGRDGAPGLNFSPYRTDGGKEATSTKVSVVQVDDTQVSPADKPESASAPKPRPANVSQRAANTAKEWAAVPVAGMPTAPVGETDAKAPVDPATPGRPDADATGAFAPIMRRSRRTRKARLRLSRIDPWSVMKTTFLFSIAFGIMLVAATFVIWSVLAGSGAMESINTLVNTVLGDAENPDNSFHLEDFLSASRVLGFATVLAAIDVVIITAVSTLFAFLYNLAATVMGGLEVTLAED